MYSTVQHKSRTINGTVLYEYSTYSPRGLNNLNTGTWDLNNGNCCIGSCKDDYTENELFGRVRLTD